MQQLSIFASRKPHMSTRLIVCPTLKSKRQAQPLPLARAPCQQSLIPRRQYPSHTRLALPPHSHSPPASPLHRPSSLYLFFSRSGHNRNLPRLRDVRTARMA